MLVKVCWIIRIIDFLFLALNRPVHIVVGGIDSRDEKSLVVLLDVINSMSRNIFLRTGSLLVEIVALEWRVVAGLPSDDRTLILVLQNPEVVNVDLVFILD